MSWFRQFKASLIGDERGSVAIQFGMIFVPLLGIAGIAADYGRALHTRQEMQSAADAAALAAAGAFGSRRESASRSRRKRFSPTTARAPSDQTSRPTSR